MSAIDALAREGGSLARALDALSPLADLLVRAYVSWEFFKSGLTKIQSWETTISLFEYEYDVPWLDPVTAAYLGTAAELALPVLIVLGLLARLSAIGLFVFNAVAVYSYWSFLGSPDGAAGLNQHIYWGLLLLVPIFHGANKLSLDYLMNRKLR